MITLSSMNDTTLINKSDIMWYSVNIDCKSGFEDIVGTYIFEAGFEGLEEFSENGTTVFKAFFRESPEEASPVDQLKESLEASAKRNGEDVAGVASVEEVIIEDWEVKWREGLGPIEIGDRLVIRPSWIKYDNVDERSEVVIDPKRAFGTGGHETTHLCLKYLEESALRDVSILDAGCGSGILAIASVRLGARCAIGFDTDEGSIDNASDNVRSNRVYDYVTIYNADLSKVMPGRFNLVMANMISSILIPNLGRFKKFLMPGGTIIFSGILAEEEEMFKEKLKEKGYKIESQKKKGEWIAIEATT